MSTLNVSVVAFIAVVVAMVMLFNFWQSRVNRRAAERLFRQQNGIIEERADIARRRQESFERGRAPEHSLGSDEIDSLYADDAFDTRREPGFDEGNGSAAQPTRAAREQSAGAAASRPEAQVPAATGSAFSVAASAAAAMSARHAVPSRSVAPTASSDRPTVTPEAPVVLDRFADDLRRITDLMPSVRAQTAELPARAPVSPEPESSFTMMEARGGLTVDRPESPPASRREEPSVTGSTDSKAHTAHAASVDSSASSVAAATAKAKAASDELTPPLPGVDGEPEAAASDDASDRSPISREDFAADAFLKVMLLPPSPVNADRLIALMSSLRHAGSKPVRIEIDTGDGRFTTLVAGSLAHRIRCSALLANRQGPLNAVELSDFVAALTGFADQLGASFAAPDMGDVLLRARRLDALAADLDTQVELTVETPGPISASQMATIGKTLGLYERPGGRFASLGDDGQTLYTMSGGQSSDQILFLLDVPRVTRDTEPWSSMVRCASDCARLVGGRLVDSQARGLSVGMIEAVGRQLDERFAQLDASGLKAGSDVSLLVFN